MSLILKKVIIESLCGITVAGKGTGMYLYATRSREHAPMTRASDSAIRVVYFIKNNNTLEHRK
jgi:hypothetical protein